MIAYVSPVSRMIAKILLLLAVLLMPFGMAAPASAAAHPPAAAPMSHCPDQPCSPSKAVSECMLACSAALPATTGSEPRRLTITCEPVAWLASRHPPGLHPDTATPPPKRT